MSGADSVSFQSLAGRSTSPSCVEDDEPVLLCGDGNGRRRLPGREGRPERRPRGMRPPTPRGAARSAEATSEECVGPTRRHHVHRCRRRAPGPCRRRWTSPPRPPGALPGPEQQLGDELVQPFVAVALRGQRVLVVLRGQQLVEAAGRGRRSRPARATFATRRASWMSASSWKRRALSARIRYVRMQPRAKSQTPSASSVRYGWASKCRMPSHPASSSSLTT